MAFDIKQGDTSPALAATLTSNGSAVDLTNVTTLQIRWKVGSAAAVTNTAAIVSAAAGTVSYTWASGDTDTAGVYQFEWIATYSSGAVETYPSSNYSTFTVHEKLV